MPGERERGSMTRVHTAIRMVGALQRDAEGDGIPRLRIRLREIHNLLTDFRDEGGCDGFLDLVSNDVLMKELRRRLRHAANLSEGEGADG